MEVHGIDDMVDALDQEGSALGVLCQVWGATFDDGEVNLGRVYVLCYFTVRFLTRRVQRFFGQR